jgi:hypothetical protein
MIFDVKFLELPRNRVDMINFIRITYDTDSIFHRKVNRIVDATGATGALERDGCDVQERNLVRELLLYGEFFLVKSGNKTFEYVAAPEDVRLKAIPGQSRREFIYEWCNTEMPLGDVRHVLNLASPYDIRGTPYFDLTTFESREFGFYRGFSEDHIIKDIRKKVLSLKKPTFFEYTVEYLDNVMPEFVKNVCDIIKK